MPEVDPTMGEPEKPPSRLEQIKYYTSLFLGALAIVCVFGFLFLVPFVLDPAISTMMHQFVRDPVHCKVTNSFHPELVLYFEDFFSRKEMLTVERSIKVWEGDCVASY